MVVVVAADGSSVSVVSSQILGQSQVLGQVRGILAARGARLKTETVGEAGGVGGGHSSRMVVWLGWCFFWGGGLVGVVGVAVLSGFCRRNCAGGEKGGMEGGGDVYLCLCGNNLPLHRAWPPVRVGPCGEQPLPHPALEPVAGLRVALKSTASGNCGESWREAEPSDSL